jgi:hypothetical protein
VIHQLPLSEKRESAHVAGARKPVGRPRNTYTRIDRDYDTLRTGMRALFNDLGITTTA